MNYLLFVLNALAVYAFFIKVAMGGDIFLSDYFLVPICTVFAMYFAHLIREKEKATSCKKCQCE